MVRDPLVHIEVIETVCAMIQENGFTLLGLDYSPVKGPEGNIEYLAYLQNTPNETNAHSFDIPALVAASHQELKV